MEEILEINHKDLMINISLNIKRGEGDCIFFIHGLGCAKETFKDVWNFQDCGFSILTLDLVGFGNSPKSKKFSYEIKEQGKVCERVIKKLNLERIHLVGHSMGGAIALLLIEEIPEKIASFMNLEGNLIGEDCGLSRKISDVSYKEYEEEMFDAIKREMRESDDEMSNFCREWMNKTNPWAHYHSSKSLVRWSDSRKLLDMFLNLKIKKTYIHGDKNYNFPILKLLKNKVKTISISDSGHFMMLENPEEFYKKLLKEIEG